jgi:hypothetical protein
VAGNELPTLTVLAANVRPVALAGFAGGVNIVVTSPAGKFGQGAGPGPEYVIQ